MATATTLQYLEETDSAGNAYSTGTSNRRQIETFIAGGAIGAGDVVVFNVADGGGSEVVLEVIEGIADGPAIGVALAAAATGDRVDVCISGLAEAQVKGANNGGAAAISSGDFLCLGDVNGTLYKYTAGTDAQVHAIAVDDVASGATVSATVIVLKQF